MHSAFRFIPFLLVIVCGCSQQKKSTPSAAAPSVEQVNTPKTQLESDPAADLYGDPVDEQAVSANQAPPFTYLQPHKGDSVFRLSNARFLPVGEKPFP